ncbi:MAG: hypothetical protein HC818_00035 [Synechococcaceae cyanobacterium RM1_1_27]|nr:hypothetical protein [Synechococcaceae cyanobacterium RM1_1_27]
MFVIRGIYAEDAHQLHPDQWVNTYIIDDRGGASYYHTCQVKDLDPLLDEYDSLEIGLQPIDENGIPLQNDCKVALWLIDCGSTP